MTDKRRTSSTNPQQNYRKYTTGDSDAPEQAPRTAAPLAPRTAAPPAASAERRRRKVAAGRIAATGVCLAAMLGLVANMEVTEGSAKAVTPAKASATSVQRAVKGVPRGTTAAPGQVAAAKVKRPIVLTPHTIVHSVSAPSSSGGYSGGSGYTAPAPAAAPVASSGGS